MNEVYFLMGLDSIGCLAESTPITDTMGIWQNQCPLL